MIETQNIFDNQQTIDSYKNARISVAPMMDWI